MHNDEWAHYPNYPFLDKNTTLYKKTSFSLTEQFNTNNNIYQRLAKCNKIHNQGRPMIPWFKLISNKRKSQTKCCSNPNYQCNDNKQNKEQHLHNPSQL